MIRANKAHLNAEVACKGLASLIQGDGVAINLTIACYKNWSFTLLASSAIMLRKVYNIYPINSDTYTWSWHPCRHRSGP